MTQDSNLLRYPDGTWGFGLPAGPLTFANGDEAMVFFYDLFRRVGANERDMAKVAEAKEAFVTSASFIASQAATR